MSIRIVTDSNADLSAAYFTANNVVLAPMPYQMNDKDYIDTPFGGGNVMSRKEFYDAMRAGAQPTTSQINQASFEEIFEPIFAAGDDVVYVAFSSGLTGTQNSARLAGEELQEKYPERKLYIADTLSASIGQGHMVKLAVEAVKQGKSAEEIVALVEKERFCLHHWFTVDDLAYLKRGGRISATSAAVGTMLNIKPILAINNEGRLVSTEKAKGRKKAIKQLAAHLQEVLGDHSASIYIVTADSAEADVELLRTSIRTLCNREVDEVVDLTPVVGAHAGPGLLAVITYIEGLPRKDV